MDIFDTKPSGPEMTAGPKITAEVHVSPETIIELYDYGTGAGLRIGEFWGGNVYAALGFDAESRRDACDRLIAVLTAARAYVPTELDPAAGSSPTTRRTPSGGRRRRAGPRDTSCEPWPPPSRPRLRVSGS
jgi:hypothetical protein